MAQAPSGAASLRIVAAVGTASYRKLDDRARSKPGTSRMLVAFTDEKIEPLPTGKRLIVACAVVRRDRWESVHHTEAAVGGVRPKRRLAEIRRVLEAAGGFGLVSYADAPTDLIARANHAWVATVLAAVGAGMALVQAGSGGLADVDLFFDTKDLAAGDRRDFEQVLRETLPELAVEAMAEFGPTHGITNAGLRFQRIEAIQKPKRGAAPSALQRGTNLAHHLCAQSARVIATGMSGRILARDNTTGVCEMLEALRRGTLSPSTPPR